MLAKPEYFSPPDEVCCWQGRRGGAAGRGAVAELLAGSNAAECHREDAADRRCGRAADRLGRSGKVAGRGAAMAKMLLAGALRRRGWLGTPWQSRERRRGMAVAREYQWQGNATADWHGNARNAKEPAPTDGTGPSQTFGYIQAEQSLVEDFACLFLLGMRIYI